MADESKLTDEVRAALELQAQGLPPVVLERAKEREEEWGTWVATQDIHYGGVLAVREGMAVPKANVELYHYDQLGWVAKRSTKAGQAAVEAAVATEGQVK